MYFKILIVFDIEVGINKWYGVYFLIFVMGFICGDRNLILIKIINIVIC